jgi:hypothetical protein
VPTRAHHDIPGDAECAPRKLTSSDRELRKARGPVRPLDGEHRLEDVGIREHVIETGAIQLLMVKEGVGDHLHRRPDGAQGLPGYAIQPLDLANASSWAGGEPQSRATRWLDGTARSPSCGRL